MADLKLIAFDTEDLGVISAHLQDAVSRVGDMAYQAKARRFVALMNRFDWAAAGKTAGATGTGAELVRRRTALRFERVLAAQVQGVNLKDARQVLSLLALQFDAAGPDDPAGHVTLVFAGNAAIKLTVECIEAELRDLGAAWQARAKRKPEHPGD